MRIRREELLQRLEAVQPGFVKKAMAQQSDCFIFDKGEVITYNGELCCRVRSKLNDTFQGAVKAIPLITMLQKMPDEEINIEQGNGHLLVEGINKWSRFKMSHDILAAYEEKVDTPGEWNNLPETFSDACSIVSETVGKDESEVLICVHLHPKWMESADRTSLSRVKIKLGLKESVLIRGVVVKQMGMLGMTKWSLTPNWMHFKNPAGLRMHCIRFPETYPNLGDFFKLDDNGVSFSIPKAVVESLDRAEVFSKENADDNKVIVEISHKNIQIIGTGFSGEAGEDNKIKYKGKPIAFIISPTVLAMLCSKHSDFIVMDNRLLINGGSFRYCVRLGTPAKKKEK